MEYQLRKVSFLYNEMNQTYVIVRTTDALISVPILDWLTNHVFRCEVSKLPRSSKQCVCDTTGTSTTKFCTDNAGVQYNQGDIFGADPTAPMCEYTRGEYITFNEQLRPVFKILALNL